MALGKGTYSFYEKVRPIESDPTLIYKEQEERDRYRNEEDLAVAADKRADDANKRANEKWDLEKKKYEEGENNPFKNIEYQASEAPGKWAGISTDIYNQYSVLNGEMNRWSNQEGIGRDEKASRGVSYNTFNANANASIAQMGADANKAMELVEKYAEVD